MSGGTLCNTCKADYYLYDKKYCCEKNNYLDGTTCKLYDATNATTNYHPALDKCLYFSATFQCILCDDG